MKLKEAIRDIAFSHSMDLMGIAPVDRFVNAPEGRRPTDLLPEAKSVISMAIRINTGVARANDIAWKGLRRAIYAYLLYGYAELNWVMADAALAMARFIERKGKIALPIPPSPPNDTEELVGMFSNRHAAVAAGLGELGWNSLLITPQYAGRLRVVSVITEAELEPDPMYKGPSICDMKKCQLECIKACPVHAISTNNWAELTIEKRTFRHGVVDKWLCIHRQAVVPGPWRPPVGNPPPLPTELNARTRLKYDEYVSPWDKAEIISIGRADRCGLCIMACPIANGLPRL